MQFSATEREKTPVKHANNNTHVAYLRQIKETLDIRKRRFLAAQNMRTAECPKDLERAWKKLSACQRWETDHGAIL